jgi:predicted transcriptional regulator
MNKHADRAPSHDEATFPLTKGPTAADEAWQDEQTRAAIREADAGDFATADEVKAVVRKFVPNA